MEYTDPVRAFLGSVLESRMEIRRVKRKLEALEARATSITSQLSGMPRGGGADRDAVLASLADVSRDYYLRLARAEQNELEVLSFIDSLPSPDSRMILKLKYVDCKRWSKVLEALRSGGREITERWMFKLHGRALNEAREKYKEWRHDEN